MAADGSIRVETKLDTEGFEKGLKDVDKMCNGTKKHLESIAESLNIKTNPIEIINNSQLAKAKKKLEEINAEVEKIQAQTDELLPKAETEEQVVTLLKLEEEQTKNLVAEQNNLNKAISEYEAKQEKIAAEKQQKELERQRQVEIKAAEKQQKDDIKSINSDVSGTVAGDDFVSKIKNAEQYEATLEKVKAKMQTIEQKTAKLAAKKGIDGSDALSANREYQKLKKQYDALIASADKFKRSSKGGFDTANSGAKKLGASMKSAVKSMAKYTLAIFGAQAGFYAVKNAIRQVLSDNEELNNTVTAMKGAFANALAPVIERVVYWLKYAFAYLNLFVKVLTGVDMAAQYNAKAINKQTEATKKNAKATKEANAQLASFDEKNVQSANNLNAADTESESPAALLDLPDVSGGKFEQICETIKTNISEIEDIAAGALLTAGLILCAVGQIPAGIACILAAVALYGKIALDWETLPENVKTSIEEISGVTAALLIAIGLILLLATPHKATGIIMILSGIGMGGAALAMSWDSLPDKVKIIIKEIAKLTAALLITVGIVLLVAVPTKRIMGLVLLLAGLAIAMGISALGAEDWNEIKTKIAVTIQEIANVVAPVLFIVGLIICLACPAMVGIGFALMGTGLAVAALTVDWGALLNRLKGVWNDIKAWFDEKVRPIFTKEYWSEKWDKITTSVSTGLNNIWNKASGWWKNGFGKIFTANWWRNKFDCIKQGMKSALNGVISAIETAVNWIVSKVNILHFDLPDVIAKKVGFSSLGFNLPYVNLPRLAKGAIVNNPGKGQAVIAGEAGAEAILPLQNNTEWMDVLVDKVAERVSMNVLNKIYLDGKEVNSSSRKYNSRFDFATNGGVL